MYIYNTYIPIYRYTRRWVRLTVAFCKFRNYVCTYTYYTWCNLIHYCNTALNTWDSNVLSIARPLFSKLHLTVPHPLVSRHLCHEKWIVHIFCSLFLFAIKFYRTLSGILRNAVTFFSRPFASSLPSIYNPEPHAVMVLVCGIISTWNSLSTFSP